MAITHVFIISNRTNNITQERPILVSDQRPREDGWPRFGGARNAGKNARVTSDNPKHPLVRAIPVCPMSRHHSTLAEDPGRRIKGTCRRGQFLYVLTRFGR